uniref:Putative secreted protein n=1 Tax=Ixodes ricinus TaxID=34613 RepID=A0A6B0U682_IXORI
MELYMMRFAWTFSMSRMGGSVAAFICSFSHCTFQLSRKLMKVPIFTLHFREFASFLFLSEALTRSENSALSWSVLVLGCNSMNDTTVLFVTCSVS